MLGEYLEDLKDATVNELYEHWRTEQFEEELNSAPPMGYGKIGGHPDFHDSFASMAVEPNQRQ